MLRSISSVCPLSAQAPLRPWIIGRQRVDHEPSALLGRTRAVPRHHVPFTPFTGQGEGREGSILVAILSEVKGGRTSVPTTCSAPYPAPPTRLRSVSCARSPLWATGATPTSAKPGEIGSMSDAQPTPDPAPEASRPDASPQAGVLGNLPRSRPAVRSPRRKDASARKVPAAAAPPQTERESPPAQTAGAGAAGDLEALARGGIAVAGGAASLGLRLAGRAAAAVRDAVERR